MERIVNNLTIALTQIKYFSSTWDGRILSRNVSIIMLDTVKADYFFLSHS